MCAYEDTPHRLYRHPLDFDAAMKRATSLADELLGEHMLLSWYDRERDLESPGHVSECHDGCETRGYRDYALNRGATLAMDFDDGRFVFCFRSLGNSLRLNNAFFDASNDRSP